MSRPTKVLIDTNLWLDLYLGERAGHGAAVRLLSMLRDRGHAILYPAHALSDVAYIIASVLKREHRTQGLEVTPERARAVNELAWACVDNMTQLAAIAPLDSVDVRVGFAHRALHDDLEDDLAIAAGLRAEVDYLVTNDAAFALNSPLPTLSCANMLALLR